MQQGETETESAAAGDSAAPLSGKRLLVVDDCEDGRFLSRLVLERAGAKVTCVADGPAALALFDEAKEKAFDLLVMDMRMPGMDGFEVTRQLRNQGCRLPVIAYTAHTLDRETKRCLEVGCDAHVGKTADYGELIHTCTSYCAR